MFRLFHRQNKRLLIGVDISSTAVKILELSKKNGRYQVESYGVSLLDEGCVLEKNILNPDAVIDALTQALAMANPLCPHAAIAIPTALVIDKLIEIDSNLTEDEQEQQVRIEAEQYIPFPLDQVSLDFSYITDSCIDTTSSQVLLAATRTEHVDARVELMELAGLNTTFVDVESYALERAYQYLVATMPELHKVVALLDIGHYSMTFTVFEQGRTIYSREHLFGGRQLSQHIQTYYGLSWAAAERAKKQTHLPKDYQAEVLSPFLDAAVQQTARALQFFQTSDVARPIEQLLLAGGSANLSGLIQRLQQKIMHAVAVVNPFTQMSVSTQVNLQQLEQDAPALLLVCGLALRCGK